MTTIATTSRSTMRRGLFWLLGSCALGGAIAAVLVLPSATAAPDPCAASEIARTIGSVSTNAGNYLDSHPQTNAALTSASQQQPPQAVASLKTYFDANPQAGKDIQTIQQPLANLAGQCKLPISPTQVLQMMAGMGQGGQPAAGTPPASGGLPGPGGGPGGQVVPPASGPSPLGATSAGGTAPTPPATAPQPTGGLR